MIGAIILTLLVIVIVKWIRDRKAVHRTFQEMGVPGPKPEFLLGNFKTIQQQGMYQAWDSWLKKYGNTFGYFEGGSPNLVTTDLDIAKEVLIKKFSNFHAREVLLPPAPFDKHTNVFFAEGETWRRLRSISSPTFSASKMKEMSPLVNHCVDNFTTLLGQHCDGKPFNIHAALQRLTLDTIANCAFGIESTCVEAGDNTFIEKARAAFAVVTKPSFLGKTKFLLKVVSPTLQKIAILISPKDGLQEYFYSLSRAVIQQRQQDTTASRVDFVQLMINARETSEKSEQMEVNVDQDTLKEETAETRSAPSQGKGMTLEEMESQSLIFLLAGFETTSTGLALLCYQLALNPDVQEKLAQEVDQHFPDGNKKPPDYISVQKLEYMDMVVKEVLRLHTPAVRAVNRICRESCVIKGLRIPKGVTVQIYNHGVHMDPNNWGPEEPTKFVPERFNPERKADMNPLAWMPFGGGPRNCVGMRFALLEMKIAMAKILKFYAIHKCEETKIPLPVAKISFRSPSEGIYVTLSKRQK